MALSELGNDVLDRDAPSDRTGSDESHGGEQAVAPEVVPGPPAGLVEQVRLKTASDRPGAPHGELELAVVLPCWISSRWRSRSPS